jgi:hypothetical protein
LISLGLDVPPLSPFTLREAKVRAFSVIDKLVAGNRLADRSRGSSGGVGRKLAFPTIFFMIALGWVRATYRSIMLGSLDYLSNLEIGRNTTCLGSNLERSSLVNLFFLIA